MNRTFKTEGIVLRRRNFGEADKLLTIFTKHYGKITLVAKGVRRTTSRKAGSLEPFTQVNLLVAKGKSLDIITETETIDSFSYWRKNLTKVAVAFYFCELVDKLTAEGQENMAVYKLLTEFLGKIDKTDLKFLVRDFEEKFLRELGFGVPKLLENQSGSLRGYIESISERKINSPKILRQVF